MKYIALLLVCFSAYSFEYTKYKDPSIDNDLMAHQGIDRFNFKISDSGPIKSAKICLVKYVLSESGEWKEEEEAYPEYSVSWSKTKDSFIVSIIISPDNRATIGVGGGYSRGFLNENSLDRMRELWNPPIVNNVIVLYKSNYDPNIESSSVEGWSSYLGVKILLNE